MSAHGRRQKGHGGGHDNAERWLLTYADMITLLVAFFIMLYAMSVTNQAKFVKLALSVRSGFGNGSSRTSILQGGQGEGQHPKIAPTYQKEIEASNTSAMSAKSTPSSGKGRMNLLTGDLETLIRKSKLGAHVGVRDDERGIVVSVRADQYTFDSGSAQLKPALKPVLKEMAAIIRKVPNLVRVEGHTDNLPIHNAAFSSNWQLSAMRASNVLTYLLESDSFNPDRFSSDGYADTRNLAPNDTDAHRAMNRRVDIVILNDQAGNPLVPSDSNERLTPAAPERPAESDATSDDDSSTPAATSEPTSTDTASDSYQPPVEGTPTHFKVQPFMPKINLKDR